MKLFDPKGNYGCWPNPKNPQESKQWKEQVTEGGGSAEANPILSVNLSPRHRDSLFQKYPSARWLPEPAAQRPFFP